MEIEVALYLVDGNFVTVVLDASKEFRNWTKEEKVLDLYSRRYFLDKQDYTLYYADKIISLTIVKEMDYNF